MSDIHIGTVIANSDISDPRNTEAMGRVLVMIRNKSDIPQTEDYVNPHGSNLCRALSPETLNRVNNTEVWAYVLQANTGGAIGSYNPCKNHTKPHNDANDPNDSYKKAPAAAYELTLGAGNNSTDAGSAANNTTDANFVPDNRDGAAKGIFCIPPIGATVAISFLNGNRGMPVVIGTLMGKEAYGSINSAGSSDGPMPDSPGATQGIITPNKQQIA